MTGGRSALGDVMRGWLESSRDPKPIVGRRRFRQELSLKVRLLASARDARDRAALLPPGPERQKFLRDARLLKTTADTLSATQLQSGRALEVWQRDRKVALIKSPK
jgi:hypothetical protein